MSPRWAERLDVVLAPRRLTCRHRAAPPWQPSSPPQVLPVPPGPAPAGWRTALAALGGWIDGQAPRPGCRVHVVLSNHFVRLWVLPWSDELVSAAARQALAARAFEARYGEDCDAWALRIGACRHGQPALACAIDAALLAAMSALCTERGLRLASVRPLLGVAFDAHVTQLPADAGLFVAEPGRITGVALERGACRSVRTLRLDGADWSDTWIERQAGLMGLAPDRPRCVLVAAQPVMAARSSVPEPRGAWGLGAVLRPREAANLWRLASEAEA